MDEFILCLRWILYAKRPLNLPEFHFAMMAGLPPQDLEWVSDDITEEQMHSFLLTSSKGFAERTKGKKPTVQFIHESVRDFLIKDNGFYSICREPAESLEFVAHEQLKHCCNKGLAFAVPEHSKECEIPEKLLREDQRRLLTARYPFAEYATTNLLYHTDRAAARFPQQHFLTSKFSLSDWTTRFNAFQKYKTNVYNDIPSFSYVCAERDLARLINRPCNAISPEEQRYGTPLIAAFMSSSWDVARILLDDMGAAEIDEIISEATRPHAKFEFSTKALLDVPWRWAIRNGLEHLAIYLLRSVSATELANPRPESHAFCLAIAGGNVAIANHILSMHPSMVHASGGTGRIWKGRTIKNEPPLVLSAVHGRDDFVELLLIAGADVTAQGERLGNALQAASQNGHEKVVQMLLDAGADVNAHGGWLDSPLQTASRNGYEKVVQMLLDAGADVNA
jgi:hypothetical protein